MEKSQLNRVWVFLTAISIFFSSCSEQSSSEQKNTYAQFDFFKEPCAIMSSQVNPSSRSHVEPSHLSQITQGEKVRPQDSERFLSVLLIVELSNGQQVQCSSSLIADDVLLTAGHCLEGAKKAMAVFYPDITCQSGYRRQQHAIQARQFKIHPDYIKHKQIQNEEDENPDLAVVKLVKSAPLNYVRLGLHEDASINGDLLLLGYGRTQPEKTLAGALFQTKIEKENYKIFHYNLIIDQRNKGGFCQGDSGGAVLMRTDVEIDKKAEEVFNIVGVNSLVLKSNNSKYANPCNNYGSAVMVQPYLSWINSQLE